MKFPSLVIVLLASSFGLMCDSVRAQTGQPSASPEMPTEAEHSMFVKGQTLYTHGLYGEAIVILSESLESFPNSSIKDLNLLWLGRSYLAQGDITNAEKTELRLRSIPDTPLLGIYEEELRRARQDYAKVAPSPVLKREPVNKPDRSMSLETYKSHNAPPSLRPIADSPANKRLVKELNVSGSSPAVRPAVQRPAARSTLSNVIDTKPKAVRPSAILDLPSLRIRIEELPGVNAANGAFSYRLVITNEGKGTAKDLTVRGELDGSLDYAGSDPPPNRQELVAQKQVLTFRLPTIEPGVTKVVQISVRSRRSGNVNLAAQTKHSVIYRDCNGSFHHTP